MGDGAVGTAVAVALFGTFGEVFLVAPPYRIITAQKQKFTVEGVIKSESILTYITIDSIPVTVDFVIFAVKAYDIHKTISLLTKLKNCCFISLSNGIGFESFFTDLSVEYAVLSMGFSKLSQFSVLTSKGGIFCEKKSIVTKMFENSLIPVTEVFSISDYRWSKWFANSVINPLGALTGLANHKLIESGLEDIIDKLSQELISFMPSENSISEGQKLLSWLLHNSTNKCSMLRDLENKNITEIDFLAGLAVKKLPDKCPTASNLVALIKSKSFYSSNSPM